MTIWDMVGALKRGPRDLHLDGLQKDRGLSVPFQKFHIVVSPSYGYLFKGSHYNYSILGSMLGSPYFRYWGRERKGAQRGLQPTCLCWGDLTFLPNIHIQKTDRRGLIMFASSSLPHNPM